MHRVPAFVYVASISVASAVSSFAGADAGYSPPASDPQAVHLAKLARDEKSTFTKDGKTWGRAHHFVNASMKDVRAVLLDYGNYQSFIPKFQKSKLLKKEPNGAAEVYLQIPILKGAATVWALERFDAPVAEGKGEKIVGHYQKGNVEELEAVWHYRPVDDNHTIVTLELHAILKGSIAAVSAKLMNTSVEDACGEGVIGVKDRAQGTAKVVANKN
ncbi:MAG: SRPBCC family protein [Polyangiales bacterium]